VAAVLALSQIAAQRAGTVSPIAAFAGSFLSFAENGVSAAFGGARALDASITALPFLERENAQLRARNQRLVEENARVHELAAAYAAQGAVQPVVQLYRGIEARVVGFPPENESRSVTIDKGSSSGVRSDDGVIAADGAVGRVVAVAPFSSTVVLVTDYTSRIPAIVRRGRWWGIARGNLTSVIVDYIEQDAALRVGDVVVSGEGRSFHSGVPIGKIVAIERSTSALYQTAVLRTSVDLGALDRVVVVPK
jgi:rod shape-determining protein MreC